MPCNQAARGIRQAPPHTGPPFIDAIDNNPCGRKIVTSSKGVDVTAHAKCLPHLALLLGLDAVRTPIVMEP